ncbi:MAG: PQQ-binding-like beta-propeller repeat protein, partial [Verrucomicrobiota bacterium]
APAAETASVELQPCPKHPKEIATATCFMCQKPICPKCMAVFGFLCSAKCRHEAEVNGVRVPKCEFQHSVAEGQLWGKVGRIAAGIVFLLAALLGVYAWYYFVGSHPSLEYSIAVTAADPEDPAAVAATFVGADRVAVYDGKSLALHDPKEGKTVWTKEVSGGGSDGGYFDRPQLAVTGNEIWVQAGRRMLGFDAQSGEEKHNVALKGNLESFSATSDAVTIVSSISFDRRQITRVTLPDGQPETQEVTIPRPESKTVKKDLSKAAPTQGVLLKQELGEDLAFLSKTRVEFVPAGENVAELTVKLIKENMVSKRVMKEASAKSSLNTKTSAASNVGAVAEDLFNEIKRSETGGYDTFDESTYEVTLKRRMGSGESTWIKQVTGPPSLFTAKTVDMVVANTKLYLLDKSNKLLAESTLSFPVAARFGFGGFGGQLAPQPCLEANDTLYFYDQGVLTAFALPSGEVKWRLTSVGISQVALDAKGMLLVKSTTASPDSIQYSEQIKLTDKPQVVIMKVDPENGKKIWESEHPGNRFFVTEKHLFMSHSQDGFSGNDDHFRIYRLNPRSGSEVWEFYQSETPRHLEFEGNRILMVMPKEIKVLKFLSL